MVARLRRKANFELSGAAMLILASDPKGFALKDYPKAAAAP